MTTRAGLSRTAIFNRLCSFGCKPAQLLARRFGTNTAAEHVGYLRIAHRARRAALAGSGQCLQAAAAAAGIAASAAAMQNPCASAGSSTQVTGTWAWSSDLRQVRPLQVRGDPYDGVAVIPSSIASDPATFGEQLDLSVEGWLASRRRGVWLKIPIEKSGLIEVAVDRGFIFHHAEPEYVMLTRWLPDGPSQLPANASTQVGVGAIVVNDDGGVLLVQEAVGPLRGRDVWKIPTGLLDAREDIPDGVLREVREETGIEASFENVVAFRHWHGAMFGKSDMFFVCVLRARGCTNSTPFRPQDAEIAKAKWGSFAEFLEQAPYPRDSPQWARIYGLALPFCSPRHNGPEKSAATQLVAEDLPHGMGRPGSCMIYHTDSNVTDFQLRSDALELDAEVVRGFDQLSNS